MLRISKFCSLDIHVFQYNFYHGSKYEFQILDCFESLKERSEVSDPVSRLRDQAKIITMMGPEQTGMGQLLFL